MNQWVIRTEDMKNYRFMKELGEGGQAKVLKVMKLAKEKNANSSNIGLGLK
jgi:hypothetical protein